MGNNVACFFWQFKVFTVKIMQFFFLGGGGSCHMPVADGTLIYSFKESRNIEIKNEINFSLMNCLFQAIALVVIKY